jgi:two-component system, chemotaxis family, response regulator WspF
VEGGATLLAKIAMLGKLLNTNPRQEPRHHPITTAQASTPYLPPLVAIGASTGGPAALAHILSGLSARFPAALVIIQYVADPRDYPYRPSVDVFIKSLIKDGAEHWPAKAAGVLLTGMGRDGAKGLAVLRRAGWYTIAQDQASSVVYGMPKAAAEVGAATGILPLEAIAFTLVQFFGETAQ